MSVEFPLPGLVDIRMPIPGNSFTWASIEPTPAKKRIVIHGTGSIAALEDGFTMADFHMRSNGWEGIGVHFVVTRDNYPGRQYVGGATPPGAQVQYVGDLNTVRAGVWGMNPGSVHIEISGLFTPGKEIPSESQLRKTRELIDLMLAPNNILPSLNYYSQVTYHNQIALPGHTTACPGHAHPQFAEWFKYLQGGPEPSWWIKSTPPPEPAPTPVPEPVEVPVVIPTPEPLPEPEPKQPEGNEVLVDEPEYIRTFKNFETSLKKNTTREAFAIDMTGQGATKSLEQGTEIEIAGTFTDNGKDYIRTVYNRDTGYPKTGQWYGVSLEAFAEPPTGQATDSIIPVTVIHKDTNNFFFSLIKAIAAIIGALVRTYKERRK
jgi:hypothetical protein